MPEKADTAPLALEVTANTWNYKEKFKVGGHPVSFANSSLIIERSHDAARPMSAKSTYIRFNYHARESGHGAASFGSDGQHMELQGKVQGRRSSSVIRQFLFDY